MKVGDLVRMHLDGAADESGDVGIIIDFEINYDRFGDPVEKLAVVKWCSKFPFEPEFMHELEVVNESR